MLKTLFNFFGEHYVFYNNPTKFINGNDIYATVLDHDFAEILKASVDFGNSSNRNAIDMASYPKNVKAIRAVNLKLHNEFIDLILQVISLLGVTYLCAPWLQGTLCPYL